MAVFIREADLARELDVLKDTLNANFDSALDRARFEWLYLDNPDGRATAWVVVDDRDGSVVGMTAVFPRRVRLARSRREVVAWNCGDFSISPRFRTMGAAVKLRRAAKDDVDAGRSPFLYAHPNERMLAVHLRVGHTPLGRMIRLAKPLRARTAWRLANRLAGAGLRLAGKDLWVRRRHDVEWSNGRPLGEEFTELYHSVAPRLGTSLVRDAAYLDWRFRRNPIEPVEILTTRSGGRLTGYLAFVVKDQAATIKDWLAANDEASDQLLAAFVGGMRRRGLASITSVVLETHPDIPRLRRFGFLRRPQFSTAITYAGEGFAERESVAAPGSWYMTVGDRDV